MTPTAAIGIYYTSELLTEWFFDNEDIHFSEADLIRHYAIDPLYRIVEKYKKGEIRPYIAREMFDQQAKRIQDYYWNYDAISWELFLQGEIPEFIYEDEWSWSVFCDDWHAIMHVVDREPTGHHVDAHKFVQDILRTGMGTTLYLVEWHQGLVYVYKSNHTDYRRKLHDQHWSQYCGRPSADADCREIDIGENPRDTLIPTYIMEPEIDNLLIQDRVDYDEPFDPSEMPSYAHPPDTASEKARIGSSVYGHR